MTAKITKFHHHVLPHTHEDGQQHHAHILNNLALFVYLQIFVFTFVGLQVIKAHAPQILGAVTFSADQIISLTNVKRSENGAGNLTYNPLLAQAAASKAANMFSENYWSHNSPSGKTPWSFISAAGYKYVYAGENLARDFNDAQSVVNAWMNSPSHKSNLLDKNFKEIGVAVASGNLTGNEGILVVQMFGSGVSQSATAVAQASPKPTPVVNPTPNTVVNTNTSTPLVSPSPTPSPTEEPSPVVAAAPVENVIQGEIGQAPIQTTVLASRQFSITKAISLGLVGFIFLIFALEVVFVARREHLKMRSGLLAHLGILAFLLLVIWYAVGGAIL